jgi:hypothetical protein
MAYESFQNPQRNSLACKKFMEGLTSWTLSSPHLSMEVHSACLRLAIKVNLSVYKSVPLWRGPLISDCSPIAGPRRTIEFRVHSFLPHLSEKLLFALSLQILSYSNERAHVNILSCVHISELRFEPSFEPSPVASTCYMRCVYFARNEVRLAVIFANYGRV